MATIRTSTCVNVHSTHHSYIVVTSDTVGTFKATTRVKQVLIKGTTNVFQTAPLIKLLDTTTGKEASIMLKGLAPSTASPLGQHIRFVLAALTITLTDATTGDFVFDTPANSISFIDDDTGE